MSLPAEIDTETSEAGLLAEANSDENTRLRDAFAQAARVSSALGG
jgi:hypothetical protein